ncbi:hypothetical protein FM101_06145 [Arthrobacter rhombi]|uniref:Uncharacterized protein n=1 Tax=Arthrobacter rhombi TaxID=71253 RepID=A0A1R4FVU1_9MICC|nr:hypothetical protein FM101_06145 [Arthrobacter rhombi]
MKGHAPSRSTLHSRDAGDRFGNRGLVGHPIPGSQFSYLPRCTNVGGCGGPGNQPSSPGEPLSVAATVRGFHPPASWSMPTVIHRVRARNPVVGLEANCGFTTNQRHCLIRVQS